MTRYFYIFCLTAFFILTGNSNLSSQTKAFYQNAKLGRGVNLGNALEAPNEGDWGVTLNESYFQLIAEKGFHSVRVPVRWSTHALTNSPYSIDLTFFQRIDWVINNALKNKLMVILNFHHYDEIFVDPAAHKDRFLKIWEQIGLRYASNSDSIIFEPLNEPHGNLTAGLWNTYLDEAHTILRSSNPDKTILVGIAEWGGIGGLSKLVLPSNDDNLILTVHYYNPFQFTHQGAEWVDGSNAWLGTKWYNSNGERRIIENEFQAVSDFASAHNIPVNVGEFGAYNKADLNSRALWSNYCSRFFEENGFSWNYWEFCSGFGIYNASNNSWNEPLVDALTNLPMPDPVDGENDNLVFNGNFEYGISNWSMYINEAASASFTVTNNECTVTVTSGGTENWHVELMNNSFKLENGKKYQIEFEVKSVLNSNIDISLGMADSPYTSYFGKKTITVVPVRTKFSYEFTMEHQTDAMARFLFDLGKNAGTLYFYNILVREAWATGKQEILKPKNYKIYPNPAQSKLIIEGKQINSYALINMSGQMIDKGQKQNNLKTEIDCTQLLNGQYLLLINDTNGEHYTEKIIIYKN